MRGTGEVKVSSTGVLGAIVIQIVCSSPTVSKVTPVLGVVCTPDMGNTHVADDVACSPVIVFDVWFTRRRAVNPHASRASRACSISALTSCVWEVTEDIK